MNPMITELQAAQAARQATTQALREARYNAEVARAIAERDITEKAGGAKALGGNEAERARAMILALNELLQGETAYALAIAALQDAEDSDRVARDMLEVRRAVIALEVSDLRAQGA